MPLNKEKELNLGEIMHSNVTLTLADLFVTHPHGVLQDVLVQVNGLVFPADFVVVDMKGGTNDSVILERPLLAVGKVLIDLETSELSLKLNNKKWCLMPMNGHRMHMVWKHDNQMEDKGIKDDKGRKKGQLSGVRVSLALDVP